MVDRLLTVSERDRDLFRVLARQAHIAVVPNGVDLEGFAPSTSMRTKHSLLFLGMMNYHPNDDGVQFFLKEIFPAIRASIPDVHLTIVGGEPSAAVRAAASPQITVTGLVPDVRPYLASAEVLIVPLRAGGGTRLKLLEAMAAGIPAVSTSIGCEGLGAVHDQHLLIADGAEAFARTVIRLLGDAGKRQRLAERARQFVMTRYGWTQIGEVLQAQYNALAPVDRPAVRHAALLTPVTTSEDHV
jgi:glycosyltransferase involved in cell wall biosynthesis